LATKEEMAKTMKRFYDFSMCCQIRLSYKKPFYKFNWKKISGKKDSILMLL